MRIDDESSPKAGILFSLPRRILAFNRKRGCTSVLIIRHTFLAADSLRVEKDRPLAQVNSPPCCLT